MIRTSVGASLIRISGGRRSGTEAPLDRNRRGLVLEAKRKTKTAGKPERSGTLSQSLKIRGTGRQARNQEQGRSSTMGFRLPPVRSSRKQMGQDG